MWKKLECEVCKSPIPRMVDIDGNLMELIQI